MVEAMTQRELKSMVIIEATFIGTTCMFAFFEMWSLFAIFALLDVLTPLWIIAARLVSPELMETD